jgi:hypothetical protein
MLWFARGSTGYRKHFRPAPSPWKSAAAIPASRCSKRWDRLRARLDLISQQRGADMADLPRRRQRVAGPDYKGKEADRLVTRTGPGVVSLVAELRGHEQAAEELEQWEDPRRGAQAPRRVAGGDYARPAADRRGVGLVGEGRWRWRNRGARTTRWIRCHTPSTGCAPW